MSNRYNQHENLKLNLILVWTLYGIMVALFSTLLFLVGMSDSIDIVIITTSCIFVIISSILVAGFYVFKYVRIDPR